MKKFLTTIVILNMILFSCSSNKVISDALDIEDSFEHSSSNQKGELQQKENKESEDIILPDKENNEIEDIILPDKENNESDDIYLEQKEDNGTILDILDFDSNNIPGKIAYYCFGDNLMDICVVDPNGSESINLTNDELIQTEFSWTPDGKKIIFVSHELIDFSHTTINIVDSDGSNLHKLIDETGIYRNLKLSPDGQKIIFTSGQPFSEMWLNIMNVDGTNRLKLTNTSFEMIERVFWFPDSQQISFEGLNQKKNSIYLLNIDGTGLRKLTGDNENILYSEWTPDGSKVAFFDLSKDILHLMDIDGSKIEIENYKLSTHRVYPFIWSPSGKEIMIIGNIGKDVETASIYILDSNGSFISDLSGAFGSSIGSTPSWSPDGKYLSYTIYTEDQASLFITNSDGSQPIQVTDNVFLSPMLISHQWSP